MQKGPSQFSKIVALKQPVRLPLEGSLDLTYRCNNHCRHCWISISHDSPLKSGELSFSRIREIAEDARSLGCREWAISGGEPMLREDFCDIFDYLTSNHQAYSLNTNGTLITPKIARLMKRKGNKMVAIYGAEAKVHEYITRKPGSFEMTMAGMNYLKEAGVGFTVQIIPLSDNFHQYRKMIELAGSLGRPYRIGAPWLYLCAYRDNQRNAEIKKQRLPPEKVVDLDQPNVPYAELISGDYKDSCRGKGSVKYHFNVCAAAQNAFHIDPYGQMSFCCFVKSPALRYDLTRGTFHEGWDKSIPALARKVRITDEYKNNCASCGIKVIADGALSMLT